MFKGHLDGIASSGYIEGWAFDTEIPLNPLMIAIVEEGGREVASGIAHLFREDLAAAGFAAGWCAFRLKSTGSVARLRKAELAIVDRASGYEIARREAVPYAEDWEAALNSVPAVIACDPTIITSIFQLQGCEILLSQFLKSRGVSAFVRAAYVYVLGRPADSSGLRSYGQLVRRNALTPFQLLVTLTDSEEYRRRQHLLAAPNSSAFPFR